MNGGNTRSHPSFPDIEDQLGYNPARFLDHEDSATISETSELAMAQAMIRGIEDVATVRTWVTVETPLDRGPRQQVIAWLNQRQATLQDTGAHETEATLSDADECAIVEPATESDDDMMEPPTQPTPSSAATTSSTKATVATDGGTESLSDPTCSECGENLTPEEIAGQLGYWCPRCSDFQEPMEDKS